MADANQGEWLPDYAIINFKLPLDGRGKPIVDDDAYLEFHANMGPGDHAFLLYNIRATTKKNGRAPIYKARVVDLKLAEPDDDVNSNTGDNNETVGVNNNVVEVDEARAQDADVHNNTSDDSGTLPKTTLFYIHGFNNNVTGVFHGCRTYHDAYPDRIVVPVMWSDHQIGICGYSLDKLERVDPAGHAIADFVNHAYWAFPRRSLVCHSMGNFVLQRVARYVHQSPEKTLLDFDDIFMVAADASSQVFDESHNRPGVDDCDGLGILQLANNQVHVLHSTGDWALKARVVANFGERALGSRGYNESLILTNPSERHKLTQVNCSDRSEYPRTDCIGHNYQFEGWAMQMYENVMTPAAGAPEGGPGAGPPEANHSATNT